MAKKKDTQKIKAFFQLLAQKKNKELLFKIRLSAGLPQYGIDWSKNGIDLSKYDITAITGHFGAYKAMLCASNPKYFDTLVSQDQTVNDFLLEYFIFNQNQAKTIENINLTGSELFSLSEHINLPDKKLFLPKGLYLRIGTNNTIKNIKDFILSNSKVITNSQSKLSNERPVRLKPSHNYFRDNFIYQFSKHSLKTLLVLAEKDGILPEVEKRLRNKAFEKKEVLIQVYIEKFFNNKMSIGAIRKAFSGKAK